MPWGPLVLHTRCCKRDNWAPHMNTQKHDTCHASAGKRSNRATMFYDHNTASYHCFASFLPVSTSVLYPLSELSPPLDGQCLHPCPTTGQQYPHGHFELQTSRASLLPAMPQKKQRLENGRWWQDMLEDKRTATLAIALAHCLTLALHLVKDWLVSDQVLSAWLIKWSSVTNCWLCK